MKKAFTVIELMIVIAIVGILATIVLTTLAPVRKSARDAKRKVEISQIGRLLTLSCYTPNAGEGDYDLLDVLGELKEKYPQYATALSQTPRDPSKGTDAASYYRYVVGTAGNLKKCAAYANLENAGEKITLPSISSPTAGGGVGILQAETPGWNGTDRYFQVSN